MRDSPLVAEEGGGGMQPPKDDINIKNDLNSSGTYEESIKASEGKSEVVLEERTEVDKKTENVDEESIPPALPPRPPPRPRQATPCICTCDCAADTSEITPRFRRSKYLFKNNSFNHTLHYS